MPKEKFTFTLFVDPYTEQVPDFIGQYVADLQVEHDIILGWFRDPDGCKCFRRVYRLGANREVVNRLLSSKGLL